jgi:mono/diheme cytochrome c family protein
MKLLSELRFLTFSTLIFMGISLVSISYLYFYSKAPNHLGNVSDSTVTVVQKQEPLKNSKADKGRTLFKSNCARCHYVTDQRMIGPGLANVMDRIDSTQLIQWVQDPYQTRKKDPYFQKLFEEYDESVMPSFKLSPEEILAIKDYIDS